MVARHSAIISPFGTVVAGSAAVLPVSGRTAEIEIRHAFGLVWSGLADGGSAVQAMPAMYLQRIQEHRHVLTL